MTWWLQDAGLSSCRSTADGQQLAAQLAALFAQVPALRERALTFKGDCPRSRRSSKARVQGQSLCQGRHSLSEAEFSAARLACLLGGQLWWYLTCSPAFLLPSDPACVGCRCPCQACQPMPAADSASSQYLLCLPEVAE